MEDVDEQYLEELANRWMVQVSEIDHTGIGVKKCRMRDLMRDMCVSKAREESFLGVIEQQDLTAAMTKSRRIAIRKEFFVPSGVEFQRREEAEMVLRTPIFVLGRLCFLKMHMLKESSFPSLEPLSGCHHLTKVWLEGIIVEDPHSSLHNLEYLPGSLAKLSLFNSKLKKDPMGILEKLPNVRFLFLGVESYEGSEMVCSANGFVNLRLLVFHG
ncbi:hypothetical protein GH714_007104 [Hevea brasiliensis]|uniref:Disease resistance protein winged helix domain-containing protein n=1 Tax=Hevea brasiliensis TaxID=3981 RepID=A0A6A6MXB5_HEVBR|nr:hypothetical protein GH714_007104 [Hevea brasiliensis]